MRPRQSSCTEVSQKKWCEADFDACMGIHVAWGGKCRGEVRHAMGIAKTLFGTKMWYYWKSTQWITVKFHQENSFTICRQHLVSKLPIFFSILSYGVLKSKKTNYGHE